jgi:ClpP class serine protease
MASKLLLSVFRGAWAIDEQAAAVKLMQLQSLLEHGSILNLEEDQEEKKLKFQIQIVSDNSQSSFSKDFTATTQIPNGSVAIIPIQDVIMQQDYCGSPGTDTMQQWIEAANQNPNITGIVLSINSPGGSADAMIKMAQVVKDSTKPVVTHAAELIASAAYGIGSSANHIMVDHPRLTEVGSIGTMMSWADMKPVYEAMGVKFHTVYATDSVDKNKVMSEANKGNYEPLVKGFLDPYNQEFQMIVQVNRAGKINLKKENVLSGKTYLSEAAIKNGLADSIGSIQDAINKVKQLATNQ